MESTSAKPDPQWVKNSLIEDEVAWRKTEGLPIDVEQIGKEWEESLVRVDKRQEEQDAKPAPVPSAAADLASELGYHYRRGAALRDEFADKLAKATKVQSPRARKLDKRLRALMECRKSEKGMPVPIFPDWHRRIVSIGNNSKMGLAEYKGKSHADVNRIAARELEDIADESRRWLGEWM